MAHSSEGYSDVPAYSQILLRQRLHLRTVIVTAAVYRGFNSGLAPLLLTFRHWAGVSPYTSAFALAETCVFAKQSPGPFHCGLDQPLTRSEPLRGTPSPEVTGSICRVP